MDKDALTFFGIITAVLALIVCLVAFRTTDTIDVTGRWWVYRVSVKYDVCHQELKAHDSCTGVGSDRRCFTQYRTEKKCTTYTRCTTENVGDSLPLQKPGLGCEVWPNDYIDEDVFYMTTYMLVDSGKEVTRSFNGDMWDRMEPGSRRLVKRNILGNVVGFGEE